MEAIIASVLGGLVGGLFTFLGVWMTIHHEQLKRVGYCSRLFLL